MPGRRAMRSVPVVIMLAVASFASAAAVQAYDPLAKSADVLPPAPLSVADQKRDRSIPLLVSLPDDSAPAPVVLFSHGLGGSREGCGYLREHWAGRGYVAVFLQHPGSDASVWRDVPQRQRLRAMKQAASIENMQARVDDVAAVLDALAEWQQQAGHPLAGWPARPRPCRHVGPFLRGPNHAGGRRADRMAGKRWPRQPHRCGRDLQSQCPPAAIGQGRLQSFS